MVATAASATVSNFVGMISTEAGLSVQTAARKVQWCVSPTDIPPTGCQPFAVTVLFIYLLGVQFRVSLSDGLAGYTFPQYSCGHPPVQPSPCVHRAPLDSITLRGTELARAGLQTVRTMMNAGWLRASSRPLLPHHEPLRLHLR